MGEPLAVDVIILSWNRLAMTEEAIKSARSQEAVTVRVWVGDQASTPETRQKMRELSDLGIIHLTQYDENKGVAMGRNPLIRLGNAPYVALLDNDAEYASPHSLAHAVQRLEERPELGAVAFRMVNYYNGEDDRLSWMYPRSLWAKADQTFMTTRFCGAAIVFKREALEKTTLLDENIKFMWEEIDLSYQLIQAGYTLEYNANMTVRHKVSPEQRHYWGQNRFENLVRNAIYVDYKHYRSVWRVLAFLVGYQVKGVINRVPIQAWRGAWRAIALITKTNFKTMPILSERARAYVDEHETRYRGTWLQRIWREVLDKLPNR